jgi:uncharacterized protein (DUF488 family)
VDELERAGIEIVVDVRQNPVSRKPGFSKCQLASHLADVGIAYVHEKTLGNPSENRDGFRRGESEARHRFAGHLIEASTALSRIAHLPETSTVALLYYERSHSQCHRELVADAFVARRPNTEIVEL